MSEEFPQPAELSKQILQCDTCNKEKLSTRERIDNGLSAGKHCDICWNKLLGNCRQRSW